MPTFGTAVGNTVATDSAAISNYWYLSGGQVSEAGTIDSMSLRCAYGGSGAQSHKWAVWKNSSNTINGATLIGSATVTVDTPAGWKTNVLSGSLAFSANDYLFIGCKLDTGAYDNRWYNNATSGDWQALWSTNKYAYYSSPYADAPPATFPAAGTGYTTDAMNGYITYTAGGGGGNIAWITA